MKNLFYLIILITSHSYSQKVTGYLYDQDGRVPNFTLLNTTQDLYSNSDSDGYFEIKANVGDSIVLRSMAYQLYTFEVKNDHFDNDIVIELKPDNLKEVVVYSHKVDSRTLTESLNKTITNDIAQNPTFYEPSKGNIGYLIHGLMGLFRRDEKSKKKPLEEKKLITKDFISLFENDEFLNEKFLIEELNLPRQYHRLFFDYLASKEINSSFLEKEKKLEFIDVIFTYNKQFKSSIDLSEDKDF